jgi:3-deoxy-manno-octulosonate cytidylyltransferase (CMP-KDO synthetase)
MGKKMNHDFHIIIPARMSSSRLPGKLLMQVRGKTILEHTYQKALKAGATSVTVATDDQKIFEVAKRFGANVLMTKKSHQSGTDRVAEAARLLHLEPDALIVNLQGDEPQMPPELIIQVALVLANHSCDWATLYWPIDNVSEWQNPNTVKVVMNEMGQAMYFSRSPIPYHRDLPNHLPSSYRHIGLYAFRNQSLQRFVQSPMGKLEQYECLEQLRALSLGMSIQMQQALKVPGQDINIFQDFESFQSLMD